MTFLIMKLNKEFIKYFSESMEILIESSIHEIDIKFGKHFFNF